MSLLELISMFGLFLAVGGLLSGQNKRITDIEKRLLASPPETPAPEIQGTQEQIEQLKQSYKVTSHDIDAFLFDSAGIDALISAVRAERAEQIAQLQAECAKQTALAEVYGDAVAEWRPIVDAVRAERS